MLEGTQHGVGKGGSLFSGQVDSGHVNVDAAMRSFHCSVNFVGTAAYEVDLP